MNNPRTMIVAIGGGELAECQTLAIDREIVRCTGKSRPRALFLPTASGDAREYWEAFQQTYGAQLQCRTDVLWLLAEHPTQQRIAEAIGAADLVYVGGGNTLRMMRRWRQLGVDVLLSRAWQRGTVMAGLSAGALCWFTWGHSDSRRFSGRPDWSYIRVRGLGLVSALACPHYRSEGRDIHVQAMVDRDGRIGIGLDDGAALQVCGSDYRVLTSLPGAGAWRVTPGNLAERLPEQEDFLPLGPLLERHVQRQTQATTARPPAT